MPITVNRSTVIEGPLRTHRVIESAGLSGWQTIALDSAVGCGLLDGSALDRLKTDQLARLAGLLVRAQYPPNLDGAALVRQARKGTEKI